MAKADPLPTSGEMAKRRQKKYIIDPADVKPQEELRVRQWAANIMRKHEHLLIDSKYPHGKIVARDGVKPEDIDIRQIYPFQRLNWYICRNGKLWSIRLRSGRRILASVDFAKL